MTEVYEKAGGIDVHNKFLVGTILSRDGSTIQARFDRTPDGILSLHDWIVENKCPVVACESTNSFWYPLSDALSPVTTFIVGNAYDMKVLSHKKTDKIDSEMIAKLALNNMILPSLIATPQQRDLRNLMRYRHFLTSKATDTKNRIHSILQTELFHLSSVLTDVFGKSGMFIIRGIIKGLPACEIMKYVPRKVINTKGSQIQDILNQKVSPTAISLLQSAMTVLDTCTEEIKHITQRAQEVVSGMYPREFEILTSMPGVGEITAMTMLAEIGDFKNFSSGDKLAAWAGLVPKVYQSADHNSRCGITHRGSKHLRWIMTQSAHAAVRKTGSRFKMFYEGKKGRMGTGKTIIALARKMLTIAWHLIVEDELFVDKGESTKKSPKLGKSIEVPLTCTLEEVIEIFAQAKKRLIDKSEFAPQR
jgi:transposase